MKKILRMIPGFLVLVLVQPLGTYAAVPEGQVLHLSFNHADGQTVADEDKRDLYATLHGGAELAAGGVNGRALILNGTSAFARVSRNPTTSDTYTLSMWFRAPRVAASQLTGTTLFSFNRRYQLGFKASGSNKVYFYTYSLNMSDYGYGAFEARSDPFVLPPDRWCHVAMVLDNGGVSFYLDGRIIGTLSGAGANAGGNEVLIGALDNDPSCGPRAFWPGAIDEVRVFGRDLTADEVAAVMAEDSPALAAERLSSTYCIRDGQMFIREFMHGRDLERALSATEIQRIAQQWAPAAATNTGAGPIRPTTVIGLSSSWTGPQDQNMFRQGESLHVTVADADYSETTNCVFSTMIWQGGADGGTTMVHRLMTMTNDAPGVWRTAIPLDTFKPGDAQMSIVGMDETGRPVLMRAASVVIEPARP